MKIRSHPININIVQVYAPTPDSTKEMIEEFYEHLENTINEILASEILIVHRDMNAKIGQTMRIKNLEI